MGLTETAVWPTQSPAAHQSGFSTITVNVIHNQRRTFPYLIITRPFLGLVITRSFLVITRSWSHNYEIFFHNWEIRCHFLMQCASVQNKSIRSNLKPAKAVFNLCIERWRGDCNLPHIHKVCHNLHKCLMTSCLTGALCSVLFFSGLISLTRELAPAPV